MDQQTPVCFTNRSGLRLFGVMHTPQGARTDLAVLLLSPGVKMRVGPQGLYRRMTDEFVRMGIPVLRFDLFGLGDSEGTLREELLRDVYNHIEVGRFVDDTIDAMDWMGTEYGTKRFILSGLCGGAITGLLAGGRDARVAGLLGLGITAVLAASSADASLYMTTGQLQATRRKYIGRLLSPQAWMRLLTLKSDYRLIWRFLSEPLKQRFAKPPAGEAAPPPEKDNANPLFPPAFFNMLSTKRPMLLVFGGTDRLQWEFEEKFVARHREKLAALPALYDVHVIEHANHVLSLTEWQRELLDVSNRWLAKHYASDLAVRPTLQPAESPA
jgi:hypothetical protein